MISKGDQEPALKLVMDRMAALTGDQVIIKNSPVGESQSNGDIENAASQVQGMFRICRSNLETRYKRNVDGDRPALKWMPRCASLQMFRFSKGSDGMTPYRRLKGKDFDKNMADYGEGVHWLKP